VPVRAAGGGDDSWVSIDWFICALRGF
jgi:hypothetical protein